MTGKLISKRFEEIALTELIEDISYGTSRKSDYNMKGPPVLRIPNIKDGEISLLDLKYSNLDNKEFEKLKLKGGDILMIRSNGSVDLVGKSAIVRGTSIGFAFAGYLIRLRVNGTLLPEFLNFALKSDSLRRQIIEMSRSTSGVNNINSNQIRNLRVPLASIDEQNDSLKRIQFLLDFADQVEQRYQLIKVKIDRLPQEILSKAFGGKLFPRN